MSIREECTLQNKHSELHDFWPIRCPHCWWCHLVTVPCFPLVASHFLPNPASFSLLMLIGLVILWLAEKQRIGSSWICRSSRLPKLMELTVADTQVGLRQVDAAPIFLPKLPVNLEWLTSVGGILADEAPRQEPHEDSWRKQKQAQKNHGTTSDAAALCSRTKTRK